MQTLAVVPIFITAGSAVLPTVLAALAGAAAALLRPSELLGLIRRRPGAFLAWTALVLTITAVTWLTLTRARPRVAKVAPVDWAAVARQIIAHEQAGVVATTQIAAATIDAAVVEAHDFARTSSDGGASPTNLKTLWTYSPADTMFLATPAVVGNRIFVAGCVTDLGGYTGILACLDAATGKPIWEATDNNGDPFKAFFSSPAVSADGKFVIIGQGFHQDKDCALLCFDAATGKLKWQAKSTEHIESSPAIRGDVAVVGVGAIEDHAGRPTGDPGHAMAVRISTGELLWRHPIIDAESSPAISENGTVYIGSGMNGHAVVAIRSQPGVATNSAADAKASAEMMAPPTFAGELWRTNFDMNCTGTMTLTGDLVLAGVGNGDFAHSGPDAKGAVVALDAKTGARRWQADFADAVLGPVAARDGMAVAPVRTGELAAIDLVDGHIRWKAEISKASPMLGGVALTSQFVYALASDATLAVLDRDTGKIQERHAMNDAGKPGVGLSSAAPQVVGGRVYVATETGGVQCLVGTDGSK
ncbi:MAG: Pyrrolo-quinoline quinone [Phycisphaerales bacterium]|nr:Pyrrolo-quinoline quinone [Phycisphaerales bacterium]